MRQHDKTDSQRGVAALEMAIGLLVLIPLFIMLLEGTRALVQYSQLQNAAMEGGRMLVRDAGDTTGVASYVQSLVSTGDTNTTNVTISARDANNNVTVKVDHVFASFFQSNSTAQDPNDPFNFPGTNPITLSASVTVALPAAN